MAYISTFDEFEQLLTIKRYSPNAINAYIGLLRAFHKKVGFEVDLTSLKSKEVIKFYKTIILRESLSLSTQKMLASALKLYYQQMFNVSIPFETLSPRSPQRVLPVILSLKEVKRLFITTKNVKHRAMLMTIYSLGLRSGELINLKIKDLNGDRNQVLIQAAKGKKDRILPFPEKLKVVLRDYMKEYRPTEYLFEGQKGGKYSPGSLRAVFNKACKRNQIQKSLTLHSLRHAYAAHLMDMGTDVRIIKELLGHNSIKSTLIYTHVTQKTIDKIPSPIDFL